MDHASIGTCHQMSQKMMALQVCCGTVHPAMRACSVGAVRRIHSPAVRAARQPIDYCWSRRPRGELAAGNAKSRQVVHKCAQATIEPCISLSVARTCRSEKPDEPSRPPMCRSLPGSCYQSQWHRRRRLQRAHRAQQHQQQQHTAAFRSMQRQLHSRHSRSTSRTLSWLRT